jgi:hypothetical protein
VPAAAGRIPSKPGALVKWNPQLKCVCGEQPELPLLAMIDSIIHHAAEVLTVVVMSITLVHMLYILKKGRAATVFNIRTRCMRGIQSRLPVTGHLT